jgi:hypothetical protein
VCDENRLLGSALGLIWMLLVWHFEFVFICIFFSFFFSLWLLQEKMGNNSSESHDGVYLHNPNSLSIEPCLWSVAMVCVIHSREAWMSQWHSCESLANTSSQGFFSGYNVKEGLTLVGVFLEGITLTCLRRSSVAQKKKQNPTMLCYLCRNQPFNFYPSFEIWVLSTI